MSRHEQVFIYILKDYVANLLCGLPNITVVERNYLHMVIAVDNTQLMAKVLDVFKQRTGNTFSVHRRPKEFGQRGMGNKLLIITITRLIK